MHGFSPGVRMSVHGCLLPCDRLATCPGCTPPPAHRLLEIGTSFPATHYGRSSIENESLTARVHHEPTECGEWTREGST
ncbi:hypothetical protein ILYODFUR_026160 [Ilyodon furcidens]|uniref:Uncharacterized protein n=1 Tax=Ilyodon furcidens TaxID=33524 RepID=A0ABV0TNP7_9TELE